MEITLSRLDPAGVDHAFSHALVWHFGSRWCLAEDQLERGLESPLESSAAGNLWADMNRCRCVRNIRSAFRYRDDVQL